MLIWMDSFDTYNTAQLPLRYGAVFSDFGAIVTTAPRTGAQHYRLPTVSGRGIIRSVPVESGYVVGCAVNRTGGIGLATFREGLTDHVTVWYNAASGHVEVRRGTVTGVLLGSAPVSFPVGVWVYFETKVVVHDTTGSVEVRVGGSATPVLHLTNVDTRNGATGIIDNVFLRTHSANPNQFLDDLYIDTSDFHGDVRIDAVMPNADGGKTEFATTFPASPPTHFDKVNEIPHDGDDSYNEDGTDGNIDRFELSALPSLGAPAVVKGVQVSVTARKTDTGPKAVRPILHHGATEASGDDIPLTIDYLVGHHIWEQNPDTASAFTEGDFSTLEIGYEVRP